MSFLISRGTLTPNSETSYSEPLAINLILSPTLTVSLTVTLSALTSLAFTVSVVTLVLSITVSPTVISPSLIVVSSLVS